MKGRLAKEAGIKVLSMDLNWFALGFIFVVSINPLCFATIFDFLNSSIHIHYSLLVIADEETYYNWYHRSVDDAVDDK